MLRLVKYLKKSVPSIIVIMLLLFLQANCDLTLPEYTADIVNVGIQQGGVESAAAKTIRSETMDGLLLFMEEEDQAFVKEHYTLEDGLWTRNRVDRRTEEELEGIFTKPMMLMSARSFGNAQIAGMSEKILDQMPESILSQAAISFVKQEYEAQGIDMEWLQNRYLLVSGARMLGLALLIMAASILVTYLSCRVAAGLSRDLRELVFKKVISFSGAEYNRFSTASLITRSTNDIQQVQMLLMMVFRIVLYAPIMGIGGIFKAWQTNPSMTWVIALAVGGIGLVVLVLFKVAMPKFKSLQKLIDRMNLVTREILQGVPVIRAFSREKHEEERFEKANHDLMKTNLFVNRCMTFMMPLMMVIMNATTVLLVWTGAIGIENGAMQVGDLMAFIQYTMQIIMSFLMLTMMSIMLPRASVSAVRINEILDTEVRLSDPEKPQETVPEKKGEVVFDHVSFAYPNADEYVLTDIDFTAKPGETTAIIGSTGCGKSSLVNLIPRFYDVTEGRVLVDGVDVRDMTQHQLHDKLGYVPQKGVLFSGTIDSNLRYGKEKVSQEQIRKAAEIAQAYDFIMSKENGFASPIAQGGTNVSGGQKQRLSIARAIARDPEIYIFDDSFSALDYKTDVALRSALKKEIGDATVIIVAQRISTILHAEQIIVLDDGKMAGKGTHKELLKNCEVYRQIASSQLSKEELCDE